MFTAITSDQKLGFTALWRYAFSFYKANLKKIMTIVLLFYVPIEIIMSFFTLDIASGQELDAGTKLIGTLVMSLLIATTLIPVAAIISLTKECTGEPPLSAKEAIMLGVRSWWNMILIFVISMFALYSTFLPYLLLALVMAALSLISGNNPMILVPCLLAGVAMVVPVFQVGALICLTQYAGILRGKWRCKNIGHVYRVFHPYILRTFLFSLGSMGIFMVLRVMMSFIIARVMPVMPVFALVQITSDLLFVLPVLVLAFYFINTESRIKLPEEPEPISFWKFLAKLPKLYLSLFVVTIRKK
ncbi:MAG: hypothetical protein AB1454_02400 [Candidatus Auribacterota bacterium]